MIHIERILQNCSEDHLLKVLFQHKNDYLFSSSFLWHLNNTLSLLLEVDLKAYNDFIFNKLPAKNRDSFDIHSYISSLCELAVMYSFLNIDGKIEFFMYEPCLRDDNKKNVEFSTMLSG